LAAQWAAVEAGLNGGRWRLVEKHVEVESAQRGTKAVIRLREF
jgi:hypothetical protein